MYFGNLAPFAPFIMVVAIVWITYHYKHKYPRDSARRDRHRHRREEQGAAAPEPAAAPATPDQADLVQVAERMEQRIAALEQLLDAKSPGWRNRHD